MCNVWDSITELLEAKFTEQCHIIITFWSIMKPEVLGNSSQLQGDRSRYFLH